jgi:hypothetical protein
MRDVALVAGYIVRCPLAGYAWQALHYLVGLRALGFDPYFFEHTAHYADCFDPVSGEMGAPRPNALQFAGDFFAAHGFGERWIFCDTQRDRYVGCAPEAARAALADAKLLVSLATVNRLPRGVAKRRVFIDIDPGVTQIEAQRDAGLRQLLDEYDVHFTIGENIGRGDCAIPTGSWTWHPTRQPVALELWEPLAAVPRAPLTTIGRWDEHRRVQELSGRRYSWSKRDEWMGFLDLPQRSGAAFELAMDVDKRPGDLEMLAQHGWRVTDPLAVSTHAERYRDYIRSSSGEFSLAKQLNVELATGWFSDRSACYLAAGRPVIVQDTGFRTALPTGAGLLTFRTRDEAVDAVRSVAGDWQLHSSAARRIAEQYFAAQWVLGDLLDRAGV